MKKRFLFLILCLGLILVFSCSRGSKVDGRMQCAYQLLNTHPDSALMLLSNYDVQAMSPETRAYYSLVYTMAQDKSGYDVNSDSLLGYAYRYYKDRENDSLYAKCNYYMGLYYYLCDSIKQSVEFYEKALQSSEHTGDLYTHYLALHGIGQALRISNPEKSLEYAKKAYQTFCKYDTSNLYNQVFLLTNIGNSYRRIGQIDSMVYYMRLSVEKALLSGDKDLIGESYHSLSTSFTHLGKPDSALFYAKLAWNQVKTRKVSLYLQLADCYKKNDSLDQARLLLHEVIGKSKRAADQYAAYNKLLEISLFQSGDKESSVYADSTLSLLKQLYVTSLDENASHQKDKENLGEEIVRQSFRFKSYIVVSVVIGIVLLLAFFSFVWGFRNYKQLSEQKIQNIKEREKAEREQIENLVQHDKQLRELEFQSALVLERAKSEAELDKQRSILNVINKQNHLLKQHLLLKFDFHSLNEKLRKGECVDVETEEFWADMEAYLDETFSDFMFKFRTRHPALKEHDVRFCMLVKLGFDNAELRRIYNRGDQAIKQRLLNLKAKLGIEHTGLSTRDYILSFENSFSL